MKLDKTLAKEIKTANGNGSRETKFDFLNKIRAVKKECSTPNVLYCFSDCLKSHGRAPVAVCLAATIFERRERLSRSTVEWAIEVLNLWTNRPTNFYGVIINDNLHPTRIEEYAGHFISMTTEN